MKKGSKVVLVIILVLLIASSAIGITFGAMSMKEIKNLKSQVEKQNKDSNEENEDNENVLIGGGYQILSTKNISDAYISGDSSKLNEEDKKTLELASDVLKEIITEDMSAYDKEKAIYEWICKNIKHYESGTVAIPEASRAVDRPIGVLQLKQAVCVGYATTFRLLTNMLNIDCMIMHDTGNSHSWDIVRLDDNCWYIVDCYMDAENLSPLYSNFNMDSTQANESHDWKNGLFPEANGTEYNYMLKNLKRAENPIDVLKLVKEYRENGTQLAYIEVPCDAQDVNLHTMAYIVDGVYSRESMENDYVELNLVNRDNKLIVVYKYSIYDDNSDDDDDDAPDIDNNIDYEKIDRLLDDMFGSVKDYNDYDNMSSGEEGSY